MENQETQYKVRRLFHATRVAIVRGHRNLLEEERPGDEMSAMFQARDLTGVVRRASLRANELIRGTAVRERYAENELSLFLETLHVFGRDIQTLLIDSPRGLEWVSDGISLLEEFFVRVQAIEKSLSENIEKRGGSRETF